MQPFCAPRATAPCPSGACALGEAGAVGVPPPGRRRFVGQGALRPPAPQNQSRGGAEGPAPALCALGAPAAPPGTLEFPPALRSIHRPFPVPKTYSQNEPAAPDERRAGIIRQKTGKVFQPVFPRFFKSGRGAEPSAASGGRSEAEAQ